MSENLSDQLTDQLLGIDRTGRVVLERIHVGQLGAHTIGETEPITGCAIVVAGRETLDVQPADPAGRQNHRFCGDDDEAVIVQILKNGASATPLVITEQFDSGAELEELNLPIEHFVLEDTHNLKAGIVGAGQEAWLGTASPLLHMQIAIRLPIEEHAQFD